MNILAGTPPSNSGGSCPRGSRAAVARSAVAAAKQSLELDNIRFKTKHSELLVAKNPYENWHTERRQIQINNSPSSMPLKAKSRSKLIAIRMRRIKELQVVASPCALGRRAKAFAHF